MSSRHRINLIVAIIWFVTGYGSGSGLFGWGTRATAIYTLAYIFVGFVMMIVINLDPRLRAQLYGEASPSDQESGPNWMWVLFLAIPPMCGLAALVWWGLRLMGFFK
jgi:hypothetical protein